MIRPLGHVRVGLVGAGFMAKLHSHAFRTAALRFPTSCPTVELARVADVDPDRARAAAESFRWREWTRTPNEVTQAEDVDLVVVATPVAFHAELSIDAAAHGKHVVCEKPLALDAAAAAAARDAAAGVLNCTAFAMRRWPAVRAAHALLADGAIGRLVKVRAHYLLDWAAGADVPLTWRFRRETAGSGSLGDVGSHLLDVMRHLAGEVESVYARTQTIRAGVDVDDAADVVLEFESGAAGLLETSWMAPGHKTDIAVELLGDTGAIRFTWARNDELQLCRAGGFETRTIEDEDLREFAPAPGTPLGLSELFVLQARDVLRGLRAGQTVTPDFLDGLRVCEIIDAALESSERGVTVDLRARRSSPRAVAATPAPERTPPRT